MKDRFWDPAWCHFLAAPIFAGLLFAACSGEPGFDWLENHAPQPLTAGQLNGNGLPAKAVVLTYDDGPDEHTLELARYLKEEGIRATFFVNGRRFCREFDAAGKCVTPQETRACQGAGQAAVAAPIYYPESVLDELIALGHRVGNHTQDHCHLAQQTNVPNLTWELQATHDILARHVCDGVFVFRAPYGEWNGTVFGRLNVDMGFADVTGPVNWDIDGNDWDCWQKGTSPEACANRYLSILNRRPRQNGIFLMHDRPEFNVTYEGPLLMTKILVSRLKADGFTFASLDEALNLKPVAGAMCPQSTPPDGGVEDAGSDPRGLDADSVAVGDSARPSSNPATVDAAAAGGAAGGSGGAGGGGGASAAAGARGNQGGEGGAPSTATGGTVDNGRGPTGPAGGCSLAGRSPPGGFIFVMLLLALLAQCRRRRADLA